VAVGLVFIRSALSAATVAKIIRSEYLAPDDIDYWFVPGHYDQPREGAKLNHES